MISVTIKSIFMYLIVMVSWVTGSTSKSTPVKIDFAEVKSAKRVIPALTLENVYREILFKEIKYPEIVMKQVVWETQWLNCNQCSLKFNNLFGFATNHGYKRFNNWVESVDYYKNWQTKLHVEKYDDYYKFLIDSHYALGESYNKALRTLDIRFITEKFQKAIPDWLRRL